MALDKLVWIGLICCLGALALNLFSRLTFEWGMNPNAASALFGFGFFLILAALAVAWKGAGRRE